VSAPGAGSAAYSSACASELVIPARSRYLVVYAKFTTVFPYPVD